jgi:dimeric dUTPase (all-alpha-NTP-PPase superfamily)
MKTLKNQIIGQTNIISLGMVRRLLLILNVSISERAYVKEAFNIDIWKKEALW